MVADTFLNKMRLKGDDHHLRNNLSIRLTFVPLKGKFLFKPLRFSNPDKYLIKIRFCVNLFNSSLSL